MPDRQVFPWQHPAQFAGEQLGALTHTPLLQLALTPQFTHWVPLRPHANWSNPLRQTPFMQQPGQVPVLQGLATQAPFEQLEPGGHAVHTSPFEPQRVVPC